MAHRPWLPSPPPQVDNETSHDFKAFIAADQVKIQYTPNPAKCAVRMWKNHFTAGIAGIPSLFLIANWCQLTPQNDMTLNMMRPCCLNPLLSAHKAMEGLFLFDATPLALLGTKVLVHLKPTCRKSWGYHAAKAWYLSHATNHYQCIRVIMRDTRGKRITDTFHFQHHSLPVPHIMVTDCILQATEHLADAITGVQEAPPNKLVAITSLRALLLDKELPPEPVEAPVAQNPVTTPIKKTLPDKYLPVIMWIPQRTQQPTHDRRFASLHPRHLGTRRQTLPGSRTITTTMSISPPPQQYPPTYPQPVLTPLTCQSNHTKPIAGPDCSHDELCHRG
jgi:hypothetical protein